MRGISSTEGPLDMIDKKTWLITGAGRGMGVEFAKAALGAS